MERCPRSNPFCARVLRLDVPDSLQLTQHLPARGPVWPSSQLELEVRNQALELAVWHLRQLLLVLDFRLVEAPDLDNRRSRPTL
jgi:hypothetical protein